MMHFCNQLCNLAAFPRHHARRIRQRRECRGGRDVARPDRAYTRADWERDGAFNPAAGQEIARDVYDYMRDVMPPRRLPRCERTAGYSAGFLMGEAAGEDEQSRMLYSAFGQRGGRCYYIGLLPVR